MKNTLSVSTPVINSCSTVRLSKKASDAGTKRHDRIITNIDDTLNIQCCKKIEMQDSTVCKTRRNKRHKRYAL